MSRESCLTSAEINAFKADFDDIYRKHDPRAYYTVLGGLDYVIPEVARPIFAQLIDRCIAERGRPITVLDIGCSYGVNAALLRHGVTLHQLRERYLAPSIQMLSCEELAKHDARYFEAWPARRDVTFMGLDTSKEAVCYARRAGLLADGVALNLEEEIPDDRAAKLLPCADIIISTGCVGYVTQRTFDRILGAFDRHSERPWVASFVLRAFNYGPIAQTLARHSLATEKFDGATFVQRRFRDGEEMTQTVAALSALGLDTAGKESEGLLHAELFVSRPEESTAARSLTDIVSLTNGAVRYLDHRRHGRSRPGVIAA